MELDVPDTVEDFVDMMVIDHISCWGDGKVIIDYMIDPEESDQILAVTFYKTGETDVVWEGL